MAHQWGYLESNGPKVWHKNFPIAESGERQSPINIDTKCCKADSGLASKPIKVAYKPEKDMVVVNNGHSIQAAICEQSVISGGPLQEEYRLVQFHLHWGAVNGRGSEHTIDGKSYDAELHLVHWNCTKYSSFEEAANKEDGLAVFGFFVKVGSSNAAFETITGKIKDYTDINKQMKISSFNPAALIKDVSLSKYYTYKGSLTTPPLYESVVWIVFDEIMEISQAEIDQLRTLKSRDKGTIGDNFRSPLDAGTLQTDRVVKRSF